MTSPESYSVQACHCSHRVASVLYALFHSVHRSVQSTRLVSSYRMKLLHPISPLVACSLLMLPEASRGIPCRSLGAESGFQPSSITPPP